MYLSYPHPLPHLPSWFFFFWFFLCEASVRAARLPISAAPVVGSENCARWAWAITEVPERNEQRWSGSTLRSTLGTAAPPAPHSGQAKLHFLFFSFPSVLLISAVSKHRSRTGGGRAGGYLQKREGVKSVGDWEGLDMRRDWLISLLSRLLYEKTGSPGRGIVAHFFVLTATAARRLRIPRQNPIDRSCGGSRDWIKGSCWHPAGACPSRES